MKLFVFGLGYSARASVDAIVDEVPGASAIGTVRNPDETEPLASARIVKFSGDERGDFDHDLNGATHLIQSIAPGENGDPVLRHHRDDILSCKSIEWLCYYSTVGVYGDFGGAWIDESAPCRPQNRRSQWRVKAEQAWRDLAAEKDVPLTILRLAGIYGPGRSQFDKLRAGTARRIVKPGQVFNRIHVQDIAHVTMRAALARLDGTFNLADDEPAPPQEVVAWAAERIGMAPPPATDFDQADMTPMARSFYSDNKRVSNAAIKHALGIALKYPTYRDGLQAVLED